MQVVQLVECLQQLLQHTFKLSLESIQPIQMIRNMREPGCLRIFSIMRKPNCMRNTREAKYDGYI